MTTLRDRLYVVVFQSDTPAGRRFDKTLLLIILAKIGRASCRERV